MTHKISDAFIDSTAKVMVDLMMKAELIENMPMPAPIKSSAMQDISHQLYVVFGLVKTSGVRAACLKRIKEKAPTALSIIETMCEAHDVVMAEDANKEMLDDVKGIDQAVKILNKIFKK